MMKKLLFTFFISLVSVSSFASHTYGGEIGWNCLPNGRYVFYMSFYRDCSGIQYPFEEETIDIVGSPLPTSWAGATISSITMKPDSNRWENERQGDNAPTCTSLYGDPLACSNGDNGILQEFFWNSDPIPLAGIPPNDGWRFFWEAQCCRSTDLVNVNTAGGQLLLRAVMFPTKQKDNVDPCIDSSPEFRSLPVSAICRGSEFTYNSTAIDFDLDSLTYAWDTPINPPIEAPVAVTYRNGYNFNNPTPDTTFDTQNIPSSLNRISGMVKMAVHSGIGIQKYATVMRVDAWREGVIIARVYRELPLSVFDCPVLPSNKVNNPPEILFDGEKADDIQIEVMAGEEIRTTIEVNDLDSYIVGSQPPTVTLVPDGLMFNRDRRKGSPCQVTRRNVEPCAYLENSTPFLDQTEDPPVRKVIGLAKVSTEFVWQTACSHVQTKTGVPGSRFAIYNFVMRVTDDHCPIPSINYPTITVRVKDPILLHAPVVKGISIGLDGLATYQWVPPIDSAKTFEKYLVDQSTVNRGFAPLFYSTINDSLKEYGFKGKYQRNFGVYRFLNNDSTQAHDLLRVVKNGSNDLDWYLRMTSVSGCNDTARTSPSEAAKVIAMESNPGGFFPEPSRYRANLNWNRPKPLDANTHSYYQYESPTHYYIWENDSMDKNGIIDRAALADSSNWYLRASTVDTFFNGLIGNVCRQYVAFRIEARDTVRMHKQGFGLGSDSLATLTFSSFGLIDTLFMDAAGQIPKAEFDTVIVQRNGDVYLSINEAKAGTIGEFKVFENNTNGNEIASLKRNLNAQLFIDELRADTAERKFVIQGINACDTIVRLDGNVFSTILPKGTLIPGCPPIYRLNWNEPSGFLNGVQSYRILANFKDSSKKIVDRILGGTITSLDIPVFSSPIEYEFQVLASDGEGGLNVSSVHEYKVPPNFRTDEVVGPLDFKCVNILSDSVIAIRLAYPIDSTMNRTGSEISYRKAGETNWTIYTQPLNIGNAPFIELNGIDARFHTYEIRNRSSSGCSGQEWSVYDTISTANVFAPPSLTYEGICINVKWKAMNMEDFGNAKNEYYVYREIGLDGSFRLIDSVSNATEYCDFKEFCGETIRYYTAHKGSMNSCYYQSDTAVIYIPNQTINTQVLMDGNILLVENNNPEVTYQWFDCNADTIILNETSYRYRPRDTGSFSVIIKKRGCVDTSECIPFYFVGLTELSFQNQIRYYPNPTNAKLNISLSGLHKKLQLQIRNLHGQLVQEEEFKSQQQLEVEIEGKAGIYFVILQNEKGEQANFKVVKRD